MIPAKQRKANAILDNFWKLIVRAIFLLVSKILRYYVGLLYFALWLVQKTRAIL